MSDDAESPPLQHRVRILAVGSNAVSAFYSWRLASSKACEVTVVWRRNWQAVQDYGIAFQSLYFGSERWKPAHVVQQVEDAAEEGRPYDYVLVCVKVIPELYELADVIADVVTPSHTCILLNTTTTIGVEKSLGARFPKNLIVSLVNFAELNQTGGFEFEHLGDTAKVWIGTALRNDTIPEETQQDMAESLALTLEAGNVDCHVSHNILQQQWEKMMGPIAFHCMSVIAQEPNFKTLISDAYSNRVVRGVLSECLDIARRQNCTFPKTHINDIIATMTSPFPSPSPSETSEPLDPNLFTTMYQDLLANRPLEFEVYLGNPVRMAEDLGIEVPNLQALYALGRHINKSRTKGDVSRSPQIPQPPRQPVPRAPSVQSMVNGRGRGIGPRSFSDGPPAQTNGRGGRPPLPPQNGVRGSPNPPPPRRSSFEGEFDQFKDIALFAEQLPADDPHHHYNQSNGESPNLNNNPRPRAPPPNVRGQSDFDLRSRELMLRERELQIREREIEMQRRQGRIRHNVPSTIMDDDEDEETGVPPGGQPVSQRQLMSTGDNFDMMSMTGRRSRNKQPPPSGRGKPFPGGDPNAGSSGGRLMSLGGRSKSGGRSASVISASQATFDPLNENPLMGFTSNRYPGVDTRTLTANSRANSLTSQRMDEMGMGPGGGGGGRTASMLGSNSAYPSMSRGPPPLSSSARGGGGGGPMMRGRPMPPTQQHGLDYGGPQNISRGYPVDSSSILAPGLPPKDPSKVRSTTGSASASSASLGGNGESHSSSSSLEPPLHSSQTRI